MKGEILLCSDLNCAATGFVLITATCLAVLLFWRDADELWQPDPRVCSPSARRHAKEQRVGPAFACVCVLSPSIFLFVFFHSADQSFAQTCPVTSPYFSYHKLGFSSFLHLFYLEQCLNKNTKLSLYLISLVLQLWNFLLLLFLINTRLDISQFTIFLIKCF